MVTQNAQQQLNELNSEQKYIQNQKDNLYSRLRGEQDTYMRKAITKQTSDLDRKYYNIEDKKRTIESVGYSTTEMGAIKRALPSFTSLSYDKSLGSSNKQKVGYVKSLNKYFIVQFTEYGSFMRNVRGMGSLAGTKDLSSVKEISKQVYEQILNQQRNAGVRSNVSFMGATEQKQGGQVRKFRPDYSNLQTLV